MAAKSYVIGLFRNEDQAAVTIEALKGLRGNCSQPIPFPSEKMKQALGLKKARWDGSPAEDYRTMGCAGVFTATVGPDRIRKAGGAAYPLLYRGI
jgi:hypothetical protein